MTAETSRWRGDEGEASPATGCEWAACDNPAVKVVEGWAMCAPHVKQHYELEAPDTRPARNLDRIAALHAKGWTDAQIAEALGCGRESVRHHRVALGLRSNYDHAARSRARSDAGRRRDRDSAARRCRYCGEWLWSRGLCSACGTRAAA